MGESKLHARKNYSKHANSNNCAACLHHSTLEAPAPVAATATLRGSTIEVRLFSPELRLPLQHDPATTLPVVLRLQVLDNLQQPNHLAGSSCTGLALPRQVILETHVLLTDLPQPRLGLAQLLLQTLDITLPFGDILPEVTDALDQRPLVLLVEASLRRSICSLPLLVPATLAALAAPALAGPALLRRLRRLQCIRRNHAVKEW